MSRQQRRGEIRAFAKEIKKYKSGQLNPAEKLVMGARINRLHKAGLINKPKRAFNPKLKRALLAPFKAIAKFFDRCPRE